MMEVLLHAGNFGHLRACTGISARVMMADVMLETDCPARVRFVLDSKGSERYCDGMRVC